ncbi:imidazole glycerol phosphate synthase subunit HisH [Candidatus Peregrinibacteria bacterium]|jgi:imidazole glycerol-phosphate synthase subunit HisH|nr:imidazole glycerol phosphate synthase subunit HisH [Candidatus Peregrinibacteria bacterium]
MITIIDYNSGNRGSLTNTLDKLKIKYEVTSDPEKIAIASKVVLPGVGRAAQAMKELRKRNLIDVIRDLKVPFLGICIGLQVLADFSEEDDTICLSIISGKVKKFSSEMGLKIPQIGWNQVKFAENAKKDPLFQDIPDGSYFYFVNSYFFDASKEDIRAVTPYGVEFPSVIKKDNFYATQFHLEKSGEIGLKLLNNFLNL